MSLRHLLTTRESRLSIHATAVFLDLETIYIAVRMEKVVAVAFVREFVYASHLDEHSDQIKRVTCQQVQYLRAQYENHKIYCDYWI